MKKSVSLKILLRSPLKAILTVLLIAAASFALFSRVTDYAITTREAAKAESFYSGVAALDNSVPPIGTFYPEDKPWPSDEDIERFSSLPGVTLAETRYSTDGLVENYKRIIEQYADSTEEFILEGTYVGYEENKTYVGLPFLINLEDVTVLAGGLELNKEKSMKIYSGDTENLSGEQNPYSLAYFQKLEKGSRCLVVGTENGGIAYMQPLYLPQSMTFRVIDGLGDHYLETKEFAAYKNQVKAIQQAWEVYDIVYTADMRAIPCFNERTMLISQGRPLTEDGKNECVVSELFLETHGLSVGDKIQIKLGDKLMAAYRTEGTRPRKVEEMPNFGESTEFEIIGAYQYDDDDIMVSLDDLYWNYSISTIFVPSSFLPVQVPEDYNVSMSEFSVFVEDAHDIKAFREAAEPLAAELGMGLRFSDGGWSGMKDRFETGSLASLFTTALYALGAALALLLAVYLYIGRNKKSYAIMRVLGISAKDARNSMALPLAVLSVFAIPAGGMAGLFYASYTASKTLAGMATANAPDGYVYVLDTALPGGVILLCLLFELAFTLCAALIFIEKMKKISPLELLQEHPARVGAGTKTAWNREDAVFVPEGLNATRLSAADEMPLSRNYGAFRHAGVYIMRHMRRSIGKTAVSLALAVVLAAGMGTLILTKLTYQDAVREVDVNGRAVNFSSAAINNLSDSDLVKNLYYDCNFEVHINSREPASPLVVTNDVERYLKSGFAISYAHGYDLSALERTGPVCLLGQALADKFGVRLGDEIALYSDEMYSFVKELYETEEEFTEAIMGSGKMYKVIGIVKSEDENAKNSIFAGIKSGVEEVYGGQPFPVGYCKFTLKDNGKLVELNSLLEAQQRKGRRYAPMASFYVDSDTLENVKRLHELLESLFPVAVAAAVLIGVFGPGLVIIQSAREAAFLRILGVTKKRARCMLVFEQVLLCMFGLALVAGGLALFFSETFARSSQTLAACFALYFLGCVCGALAASVQVTRNRVLELLQVKE